MGRKGRRENQDGASDAGLAMMPYNAGNGTTPERAERVARHRESDRSTFTGSCRSQSTDDSIVEHDGISLGRASEDLQQKRVQLAQYNELLDNVLKAKSKAYQRMEKRSGYQLLDNAMAKMVNPTYFGATSWPSPHQAHRCFLHKSRKSALIISDGLSNPYSPQEYARFINRDYGDDGNEYDGDGELGDDDDNDDAVVEEVKDNEGRVSQRRFHKLQRGNDRNIGYGFEVYAEFVGHDQDALMYRFTEDDWVHTWEALLVDYISQTLASQGCEFLPLFQSLEACMSLEIPEQSLPVGTPPEFINQRGTVGVLLFVSSAPDVPNQIKLPTGKATLIAMRVLNDGELHSILVAQTQEEATEARLALAKKFSLDRSYHRNILESIC